MNKNKAADHQNALETLHLGKVSHAYWNLTPPHLVEHAMRRGEAKLTDTGALAVRTGTHTGRSPNDKFVVDDATTHSNVWWGKINQPFTSEKFDALLKRVGTFMDGHEVYVQDLAVGCDPAHRLPIRVITQNAWQSLFAHNMFLRPTPEERDTQEPAFTIIHVPSFNAIPERDGTRSAAFVILDFTRRLVLIGGTSYAGEIKKSVFTIMNYLLPAKGVLPMHCSANIGDDGRSALFFGLSGTGKTTLSADPGRQLIGDDEHGWSGNGIFNFEGGCYAKAINLSAEAEPEIFAASNRFGTILENVVMDVSTRTVDFTDNRYAENTRSSYPVDFISNIQPSGQGGHPAHVVMLTCDAFGVLPPISRLTPEQAEQHYLLGYTARVAGTEKGVTEPTAVFSPCFGAPFLPRPPKEYAKLLHKQLTEHKAQCWLINTGWSGGGAQSGGKRMSLSITRALLTAALSGALDKVSYETEPFFGLSIPTSAPNVPGAVLNPRGTWQDGKAYDETAKKLAQLFKDNEAKA